MKTIIQLLTLLIILSGCASMHEAFEIQRDYFKDFTTTTASPLKITSDKKPKITRGLSKMKYSAFLPKGTYTPIGQSKNRVYYLAPRGFYYKKGKTIDSRTGGIVQVNASNNDYFYVWYAPDFLEYIEIDPNGEWIDDIKPSVFNVLWVDSDLKVYR